MSTGSNALPYTNDPTALSQALLAIVNIVVELIGTPSPVTRKKWQLIQRDLKPVVVAIDWEAQRTNLEDEVRKYMPNNPSFAVAWEKATQALAALKAFSPTAPETLALDTEYAERRKAEAKKFRESAGVQLLVKPEERGKDHWSNLETLVAQARDFDPDHEDLATLVRNVTAAYQAEVDTRAEAVFASLTGDLTIADFKAIFASLNAAGDFLSAYSENFTLEGSWVVAAYQAFNVVLDDEEKFRREKLEEANKADPLDMNNLFLRAESLQMIYPLSAAAKTTLDTVQPKISTERTARLNAFDRCFNAIPRAEDEAKLVAYLSSLDATAVKNVYDAAMLFVPVGGAASNMLAAHMIGLCTKLENHISDMITAKNVKAARDAYTRLATLDPQREKLAEWEAEVIKAEQAAQASTDPTINNPKLAAEVRAYNDADRAIINATGTPKNLKNRQKARDAITAYEKVATDPAKVVALKERYDTIEPDAQLRYANTAPAPQPDPVPAAPGAPANPEDQPKL